MTTDPTYLASVDEDARRRFEADWRAGRPQPLEHYLPPADHSHYRATLEELVLIELEMRWKSRTDAEGDTLPPAPALVETYLAHFPELYQPEVVLRLLKQEYLVRRRYGDRPTAAEYQAR